MRAEEIRKIYTYNMCHAVLSYHGHMKGYELLVDCLNDPYIKGEALGALKEISQALQAEYDFSDQEMGDWIEGVLIQTNNPTIGDTVVRSAADPIRKLAHDDRLIGPILLCLKHQVEPKHIIRATAAALYYQEPGDAPSQKLSELINEEGLESALKEVSGLEKDPHHLINQIINEYDHLPVEYEWQKKAQLAYDLGFRYEKEFHGCGQCVIAAVTEVLGIFDEEVFNSATGLCGGIGLVNIATCSALTGGAMVIGMVFHRSRQKFDGDRENKYLNFKLIQQLREKFLEKYNTATCGEIHTQLYGRPYDMRDKAERDAFESAGGHGDHGCTEVVANASKWTIEVLAPYLEKGN